MHEQATLTTPRAVLRDAPPAVTADHGLHEAAAALRAALAEAQLHPALTPAGTGAGAAAEAAGWEDRAAVLDQLDDYLLPRLATAGRPPLVVVGGPTGVGKSTLVNSLVGRRVTEPGLTRPTTRSAVLVHHPDDGGWFAAPHLLPTLTRTEDVGGDPSMVRMVATRGLPRGVAVMDAPDFDSVDEANRALALRLLGAADIWLFVTSAARYSDQLPWRHLQAALDRGASVIVVMNRIPSEDRPRVAAHLERMLAARSFPTDRTFYVENAPLDEEGALPATSVAAIREALERVAEDRATGSAMVGRTVAGALRRAVATGRSVAEAADAQAETLADVVRRADGAYDEARTDLADELADGGLVSGQLAARWTAFTGLPVTAGLGATLGAVRGRLGASGAGAGVRTGVGTETATAVGREIGRLELAVNVAVESLLVATCERAATAAAAAVGSAPHGDALLTTAVEDLARPSRTMRAGTPVAVSAWLRRVGAALHHELLSNDLDADLDATGVRALALGVCVHVLATRGLLAAAASADREGLHGVAITAAEDLLVTTSALLESDRERYRTLAATWQVAPGQRAALRAAATGVDDLIRGGDPALAAAAPMTGAGVVS